MRLQHVELVVTLAEHGSLSAAASHLNKSQPAISKALRQLEADLGVAIFNRTPHGVTPTTTGAAVIRRCVMLAGDLRRLDEEVHQLSGDVAGRIDVIVSPLAAVRIIPEVAARFANRFPQIKLCITGGQAPKAFGPLLQGDADFVIGPAPAKGHTAGLRTKQLLITPISILTGHSSRFARVTQLRDLQTQRWVQVGPPGREPLFHEFFRRHRLTPPEAMVTSDSILSALAIIENSDLLCAFPTLMLPEVFGRWRVQQVPLTDRLESVPIALTTAKNRLLTPAAMVFADLVREVGCKLGTDNPEL